MERFFRTCIGCEFSEQILNSGGPAYPITAVREIGNRDKKFGKNGARPRRPQGTASPTNLKI